MDLSLIWKVLFCFGTLCTDWLSRSQAYGYDNLALNRLTWQRYPLLNTNKDVGSENAVDGLYFDRGTGGQCTISADKKLTSEWRVDLGNVASISHINIYYRTDNQPSPTTYTSRMAGFFLYISNTTSKEDGHLCYHEIQNKTGTPLEDMSIKCQVHGRYVIYYNERRPDVEYPIYYSVFAYVELCEVEVYGCRRSGYFGDTCTMSCPTNCKENKCHISTGHCFECLPGFRGKNCTDVCNSMTYGPECASSCGNCSNGETCNFVNGSCPHGCAEGAKGELCQISCPLGIYGKNCLNQCSENCHITKRCDKFTGQCDGGCKPGWEKATCDQKCTNGRFGINCRQECGQCLKKEDCHHLNGTCLNGCLQGFRGTLCEETCPSGSFGFDCSFKCNAYCKGDESCDPGTGICYEGCKDGWSGFMCGKENESSGTIYTVVGVVTAVVIVVIVITVVIKKKGCPSLRNKHQRTYMDNSEAKQIGKKKEAVEVTRTQNVYIEFSEISEITRTGEPKI